MRLQLTLFALAALTWPAIALEGTYPRVGVEDFFLDRRTMVGRRIEVQAEFQSFGDLVYILFKGGANATFVNIDGVNRLERKALLNVCTRKCTGTVRGMVVEFPGDIGIKADDLSVSP